MSVTLGDIAKVVGVSQNTISRALRNKSDISESTCERIQSVAQMMGYRPNSASRALRYRSFRNIGVLAGHTDQFYLPQQTMSSLSQHLALQGYSCSMVCPVSMEPEELAKIPLLEARMVDSLVISYIHELPPKTMKELSRVNLPAIWLNRWLDHDSITMDEADAVEQLMEHLARCGYRRVRFVDYTTGGQGWVTPRRLQGFDIAAERLEMEATRMVHRRVPRQERFKETREWLKKSDRPEAVIASSITVAQAIIQTALYLGMRIPDDIAVVSFDDGFNYDISIPSITCAVRPETEFGRVAAAMAIEKATHAHDDLPSRSVRYSLVIGGSTVKVQGV